VGRVSDDALGRFYAEEMNEGGTDFVNPPVQGGGLPTSRSMIFVSPDGERSMNTYLGVSAELSSEEVSEAGMGCADMLFLEGYLFDKDKGKAAFMKAADDCHKGGGKTGIALSDPFCVDRHRDDFRALVRDEMDYVIGNAEEWKSLYQVSDLDAALAAASADCSVIACTRSGEGVSIVKDGVQVDVPVTSVVPVDATGAGDQFAAGFLFGLAKGRDMEACGRMGCVAAGEVISHIGPRPEADLKELFAAQGLI
jgi:sugar/nucleoside kinase (ribokinase family)